MTLLLVILIRLLVPFAILRWRFVGALLSMAADASDVILFDALGGQTYGAASYHTADKFFDMYYLSFMLYVSLSWTEPLEKRTSIVLYCWRLLGILSFEITQLRLVLLFAPNIFENFYLLVTGVKKVAPQLRLNTGKKLVTLLVVSGVPKLIQEYIMHYLEFPTWPYIKENILRWR